VDEMAVNIILPQIVMNNANRNSGIAIGENSQPNWHAHSKNNYGVGSMFGFNVAVGNVNILFDSDFVDAPIFETDPNSSPQNQQL
jgi:hypothetical protein